MDGIFGTEQATAPVAADAVEKQARKEKVQAMKTSLKETLANTPDFTSKLRTLSDSIEVVHTLGFGKGGNIVVDKAKSNADDRVLKPTSAICGYELKNNGKEVIPYTTEVWSMGEGGKYVGQTVQKQWNPGESIMLTRQYTTMLCSIPEISFTLANGKIICSSKKNARSLKEELSAYYFSFNKDMDANVNDDDVKLSVDDAEGKVKPEFVETFGYLNNPKEGRAARAKGPKLTTQDLAANYVYKLIGEQGV